MGKKAGKKVGKKVGKKRARVGMGECWDNRWDLLGLCTLEFVGITYFGFVHWDLYNLVTKKRPVYLELTLNTFYVVVLYKDWDVLRIYTKITMVIFNIYNVRICQLPPPKTLSGCLRFFRTGKSC